jgi:hypothetical protein
VGADGVAATGDLLQGGGVGNGHAADREEGGLDALLIEGIEDRPGVAAHGAVVEGQHDLAGLEELGLGLQVLVAELGAGRGVDLDHARDAENACPAGAIVDDGGPQSGIAADRGVDGQGLLAAAQGRRGI